MTQKSSYQAIIELSDVRAKAMALLEAQDDEVFNATMALEESIQISLRDTE